MLRKVTVWLYVLVTFIIIAFSVVIGWNYIYYRFVEAPAEIAYVGSSSCLRCHQSEYKDWHDSLHRKMMRKVSKEGTILADFNKAGAPVGLYLEDIQWVIGSKWEQQFMGHNGQTETLLPGAWNVTNESWKNKSWDGWTEPVPVQRCHGCHTVGLDTSTGNFVEEGIACESCHGPGQWHVKSRGVANIYNGFEAEQCGQCHARGRSKDGATFFPYGFKPGQKLKDFFVEKEPDYLQNSAAWWGNGRERKRHQEYTAWKFGGHANALKSLAEYKGDKYGKVTPDCLVCHSAEGYFARGKPIKLNEARNGVTCAVCHQVHGKLDQLRAVCEDCHSKGPYYHQPVAYKDHVPGPVDAKVGCVSCHMPLTVKNGGSYSLHSHYPGIVRPQDSEEFGVPNSCANGECHKSQDVSWLKYEFNKFYGAP